MREIKFRAWNERNNEMTTPYIWLNSENLVGQSMIGAPSKVMQYTGLKDINFVEIYEGDIVEMPYINPLGMLEVNSVDYASPVFFENGEFCIYSNEFKVEKTSIKNTLKQSNGEYISNHGNVTVYGDCVLSVIGNIHKNPELLESK